MKIVKFQAENIMKLSAIEIIPSDNMILITGKNGAGKSSVLDSIVMALSGGKSIPEQPVKRGTDKGKIIIDMGEFTITRSFTKDNSYLKIESADGKQIKSPQKFLDDLIGQVSFDPLDFINNHKESEQRDILLQLIGVDVNKLDQQEKELRDERQIIGQDVKRSKALLDSAVNYSDITETKEIAVSDLTRQLTEALSFNQSRQNEINENEGLKVRAQEHRKLINANLAEIIRLQELNIKLEAEIVTFKSQYQSKKEELESRPGIDISNLQQQISEVDAKNTKIRANNNYITAKSSFESCTKQYTEKTSAIESIEVERKKLLSSSSMPVAGLGFTDTCLTYNSIPLSQCSDGEKLMVSLNISMALNPKLRVLRIKDGSLLDDDNRQILYNQIKSKDYQLWMESVSSDKKVGIFIEEGEIVAVNGIKIKDTLPIDAKKSKNNDVPKSKEVNPAEGVKKDIVENIVENIKPQPEIPEDW